ncbi:Rep family protein, partial [Aerococcus viridans]
LLKPISCLQDPTFTNVKYSGLYFTWNLQGAVQYLWHRNNPEKYQYNKSDVVAHNGFKYRQYLTDIGVDTDTILQEIIQWVQETGCSEYGDLVNYSVSEKFDD